MSHSRMFPQDTGQYFQIVHIFILITLLSLHFLEFCNICDPSICSLNIKTMLDIEFHVLQKIFHDDLIVYDLGFPSVGDIYVGNDAKRQQMDVSNILLQVTGLIMSTLPFKSSTYINNQMKISTHIYRYNIESEQHSGKKLRM